MKDRLMGQMAEKQTTPPSPDCHVLQPRFCARKAAKPPSLEKNGNQGGSSPSTKDGEQSAWGSRGLGNSLLQRLIYKVSPFQQGGQSRMSPPQSFVGFQFNEGD